MLENEQKKLINVSFTMQNIRKFIVSLKSKWCSWKKKQKMSLAFMKAFIHSLIWKISSSHKEGSRTKERGKKMLKQEENDAVEIKKDRY